MCINDWGYSKDRAYKLIQRAYESLTVDSKDEIDNARGVQIRRITEQLEKALEDNDKKTYLKLLDMLNKIYSLYIEKQQVELSIDNLKFSFGDEVEENVQDDAGEREFL